MKRNPKKEKPRLAVGLMSGTSMDGIDAALVRISGPPEKPRVRLLAFSTTPYLDWLRERLLALASGDGTTAEELSRINTQLGSLFAEAAINVCRKKRLNPKKLLVIGSHGQTIHHCGAPSPGAITQFMNLYMRLLRKMQSIAVRRGIDLTPREGVAVGFDVTAFPELRAELSDKDMIWLQTMGLPHTLQIAESAVIAERTGVLVVADFRTADMAAGGQGAPLVPMVDYLLLRHAREGRVALNIGGIANFTVIPAGAKPEDVFGFDTGPGNMVMDALARHFTKGRESYDAGGRVASRGKVDEPVLTEALADPFFRRKPPKSAGREQFGQGFMDNHFLTRRRLRFEDAVRTATELTARTITDALERFVFPRVRVHRLVVSGGGARNKFLLKRLADLLPRLKVELSDRYGLPVDAKEAIAFAILADRTMRGLPGNLPSVTGARRPVVLGKLVKP